MDHSTNPLSSDLYKIRFKHSTKRWPRGRFIDYKERLDKSDGNIVDITCTRTFPIVPKRKKLDKTKQVTMDAQSSIVLADPIVEEYKKKLVDKQTDFYANFLGQSKIRRVTTIFYYTYYHVSRQDRTH